jgi:hypothetical protein
MRLIAALLLVLHGLAHLIGFHAAFLPAAGVPLRAQLLGGVLGVGYAGSRLLGVAWLLLALGFVVSAFLLLRRGPNFAPTLLWTTGLSAAMCVLFWPDARIGLFIDVVLFVVVLFSTRASGDHLAAAFERELRTTTSPARNRALEMVDELAVRELPPAVRRYLQFMGVVGRPRDWSIRAHFKARFRRAPGAWQECEALQYDTRLELSRVFYMQLSLKGVLPVTVRDTYVRGRGSMRAKAFDVFNVVDGKGYEIDVGELVTYLNDAILMAPSLLLGPETTWKQVNDDCFDVTLSDHGLSVTARVWLDQQGAPVDFSTTDRFFEAPDGKLVRTEWRTPVSGWQRVGDRQLPTHAQAVWQLPSGPFAYADFSMDPSQIAFNVPPL